MAIATVRRCGKQVLHSLGDLDRFRQLGMPPDSRVDTSLANLSDHLLFAERVQLNCGNEMRSKVVEHSARVPHALVLGNISDLRNGAEGDSSGFLDGRHFGILALSHVRLPHAFAMPGQRADRGEIADRGSHRAHECTLRFVGEQLIRTTILSAELGLIIEDREQPEHPREDSRSLSALLRFAPGGADEFPPTGPSVAPVEAWLPSSAAARGIPA